VREFGLTPVGLLAKERLLGPDFTAVHAVHVTEEEIAMMAEAGMTICSCPTTERNLGDGIFQADEVMRAGVPVALGSDSQAQIDSLEDAREVEYHLRLQQQKRAVLDPVGERDLVSEGRTLAGRLFDCATMNGARSLGVAGGDLRVGMPADFFTVDLKDVSIGGSGAEDFLPLVVFGLNRSAIRDVVVNGRFVLRNQRHALEGEIVERYSEIHQKLWRDMRR
jgi:formimidoylglutamate deiminase